MSTAFNYGAGYVIGYRVRRNLVDKTRVFLVVAIATNLMLLGYFKYANFFVHNVNSLADTSILIGEIILPLGISFFTFTQIAFLVDTYQGKVKEFNFIHYTLFVTYFPHLIAGPVLHHKEMMPQFSKRNVCNINWQNISVGLSIFILGLTKKVIIADSLAEFSTPIFSAAAAGGQPMMFEAWIGTLSYTLQLYFDFSAYSEMAIGLSLMLNVRLPMNFNSPYKSTSIIDFWRSWHMTLSRFLRDYLYIPLGGSRNGNAQRYLNLMITMLLGGFWHGAGWTFVVWGGLHGFYLMVNHAWRGIKEKMCWSDGGRLARVGAGAITFIAIVIGWVFFRADDLSSAMTLLQGMIGMNGISLPTSLESKLSHHFEQFNWIVFNGIGLPSPKKALAIISLGFTIVWLSPNILEIFSQYNPTCDDVKILNQRSYSLSSKLQKMGVTPQAIQWNPTKIWTMIISSLLISSLVLLNRTSVFLYFQF